MEGEVKKLFRIYYMREEGGKKQPTFNRRKKKVNYLLLPELLPVLCNDRYSIPPTYTEYHGTLGPAGLQSTHRMSKPRKRTLGTIQADLENKSSVKGWGPGAHRSHGSKGSNGGRGKGHRVDHARRHAFDFIIQPTLHPHI